MVIHFRILHCRCYYIRATWTLKVSTGVIRSFFEQLEWAPLPKFEQWWKDYVVEQCSNNGEMTEEEAKRRKKFTKWPYTTIKEKSSSEWDISVWQRAILEYSLRELSEQNKKSVQALVDVRNRIAHNESTEFTKADYYGVHQKLISNYKKLLGEEAAVDHTKELEKIKEREY